MKSRMGSGLAARFRSREWPGVGAVSPFIMASAKSPFSPNSAEPNRNCKRQVWTNPVVRCNREDRRPRSPATVGRRST
jgi:hypothetical protein